MARQPTKRKAVAKHQKNNNTKQGTYKKKNTLFYLNYSLSALQDVDCNLSFVPWSPVEEIILLGTLLHCLSVVFFRFCHTIIIHCVREIEALVTTTYLLCRHVRTPVC